MVFDDLPGQDQADAAAAGFGGEEGHEQVLGLGQTRAIVFDFDQRMAGLFADADTRAAAGLQGGFGGVLAEVDQCLLDLVGVGVECQFRQRADADRATLFQACNPAHQRRQFHLALVRRRQAGQSRVRGHEAGQRFGAVANDAERTLHIFAPVLRQGLAGHQAGQRAGHRAYRRQGVVEFMAEDADQTLPGLAFFLAQRSREIADRQQLMRLAALAETGAAHFETAGAAGKGAFECRRGFHIATGLQAQIQRAASQCLIAAQGQQTFAGWIDQHQMTLVVEGKDGDLDAGHDLGQQRAGFLDPQAFFAERAGERIDLPQHFTQRVAASGGNAAQAVVAGAQGVEQIDQRQQRMDDGTAQAEPDPRRQHHQGDHRNDTRGAFPGLLPDQQQGHAQGGQGQGDGQQRDLALVGHAVGLGIKWRG